MLKSGVGISDAYAWCERELLPFTLSSCPYTSPPLTDATQDLSHITMTLWALSFEVVLTLLTHRRVITYLAD
jgi:hypothetical protein